MKIRLEDISQTRITVLIISILMYIFLSGFVFGYKFYYLFSNEADNYSSTNTVDNPTVNESKENGSSGLLSDVNFDGSR